MRRKGLESISKCWAKRQTHKVTAVVCSCWIQKLLILLSIFIQSHNISIFRFGLPPLCLSRLYAFFSWYFALLLIISFIYLVIIFVLLVFYNVRVTDCEWLIMSVLAPLVDQNIYTVPTFTLENGRILREVPVAYKTWGKLNDTRDNVMIICHAFTGSADVEDWWDFWYLISTQFLCVPGGAPLSDVGRPSTPIAFLFSVLMLWAHHMDRPLL
jgi:hypothetical protein